MTFDEFTQHIDDTRPSSADQGYVSMALIANLGELYGHFARSMLHERPPDMDYARSKLAEALWHLGAFADDMGSSLEELAQISVQEQMDD